MKLRVIPVLLITLTICVLAAALALARLFQPVSATTEDSAGKANRTMNFENSTPRFSSMKAYAKL